MAIYCLKKICIHNSACCSHYDENKHIPVCKLEDILINDEVECDRFKAEYKKIDMCRKCSLRTGVISFELNRDIKVTVTEADDFDPSKL